MSVVGPLLKKFPIEARQHEAINKMKLKKSPNARVFSFEDIHFKQGFLFFYIFFLKYIVSSVFTTTRDRDF